MPWEPRARETLGFIEGRRLGLGGPGRGGVGGELSSARAEPGGLQELNVLPEQELTLSCAWRWRVELVLMTLPSVRRPGGSLA